MAGRDDGAPVPGEDDEPPLSLRDREHRLARPGGGRLQGLGEGRQRGLGRLLAPGGLGDEQPEGGVEQPAVHLAGHRARVVRLAGEHQLQHRGAEPLFGRLERAGPLRGEGEQGDGRVHRVPLGRPEGRAGADGERAAHAPSAPEGLELDAVVRTADDGARGRRAVAEPLHVGGEPGGPAGGPLG
ncbi:hypothetical protein SNARM312S_03310 [Streptomyces narbonensis]